MMMVPTSIVLIVGYVSSILWTIGLAFLITGIVVVVAAEKRRQLVDADSGRARTYPSRAERQQGRHQ